MKTKKQFKYFSIFNYEKEQEYLSEMHRNGWKFLRVTGIGVFHFEECEPADVVYQLDYNKEGHSHKAEYVQMFHDCGWEYIQDYADFSYFRKNVSDMHGDEEIFCDDASRLALMERIYKGRLLPLVILFSAVEFPQFVFNLLSQNYGLAAVLGAIVGLYLWVFASFGIKMAKFKKNMRE